MENLEDKEELKKEGKKPLTLQRQHLFPFLLISFESSFYALFFLIYRGEF